jgi:hypothetical protein
MELVEWSCERMGAGRHGTGLDWNTGVINYLDFGLQGGYGTE